MSSSRQFSNDESFKRSSSFMESFLKSGSHDFDEEDQPNRRPSRSPYIDSTLEVATATSPAMYEYSYNRSASLDDNYNNINNQGITSRDQNEIPDPLAATVREYSAASTISIPESAFGEEEVLEQYRIMAQHDALLRLKENTGFDPAEYERRRKLQPSGRNNRASSCVGSNRKPHVRLPPLKKITASHIALKLEEPPMPPPRVNNYFSQQVGGLRVQELCVGTPVNGMVPVGKDERLVCCLGCGSSLRVKASATLVSCPGCHTVGPTSSTNTK